MHHGGKYETFNVATRGTHTYRCVSKRQYSTRDALRQGTSLAKESVI